MKRQKIEKQNKVPHGDRSFPIDLISEFQPQRFEFESNVQTPSFKNLSLSKFFMNSQNNLMNTANKKSNLHNTTSTDEPQKLSTKALGLPACKTSFRPDHLPLPFSPEIPPKPALRAWVVSISLICFTLSIWLVVQVTLLVLYSSYPSVDDSSEPHLYAPPSSMFLFFTQNFSTFYGNPKLGLSTSSSFPPITSNTNPANLGPQSEFFHFESKINEG